MSDGEDDAPSNVLRLVFKQERVDQEKQTDIKGKSYACRHQSVVLDEETRTMACGQCGKPVDMFDYLMGYARGERQFGWWREEEKKLRANLELLREEERLAKQRIKAASKRDIDGALKAERKKRLADSELILKWSSEAIENMRRVRRAMLRQLADEAIETDDRQLMQTVLWEARRASDEATKGEKTVLERFKKAIEGRRRAK